MITEQDIKQILINHSKVIETDNYTYDAIDSVNFDEVARDVVKKLTTPVVVECKHDFEPYYNWCSELTGYRCEKCGEEKD